MSLIKIKTAEGWISLYQAFINSCLKRDKNLGDILNKEEARKNLELTGEDNHTHYHDDRYVPLIEGAKDEMIAELQQVRNEIEIQINNITTNVSDNTTVIDQKLDADLFVVGETAPSSPKDKTIWFNIKSNGESTVKVWYNGQWNTMGAAWK